MKRASHNYLIAFFLGLWFPMGAIMALADQNRPLIVFAAASLKLELDTLALDYEAKHGQNVLVSYGASAALAQQISVGAPVDLFISAAPKWMDVLQKANLLVPNSRRNILQNNLVLLAFDPKELPFNLTDRTTALVRLTGKSIATGHAQSVPLGSYGTEALRHLDLYSHLESQLIPMQNANAAFHLVENGITDFAIAYGTTAKSAKKSHVVAYFSTESHAPILYPMAAVIGPNQKATLDFYNFLQEAKAKSIFTNAGFRVLN